MTEGGRKSAAPACGAESLSICNFRCAERLPLRWALWVVRWPPRAGVATVAVVFWPGGTAGR